MTAPWWYGIPPAVATVECSGHDHRLRWRDGELDTADHEDVSGERTLAALAGQRCHCIDLLDAWQRHRADLDVLVLASRGPADILRWPPDGDPARGRGFFSAMPMAYGRPHISATATPGIYAAAGWRPAPNAEPAALPPEAELPTLLTLGGGLPDRLVATVVAEWARRQSEQPGDHIDARLPAALYGRATAAVHTWLGEPGSPVDVNMISDTAPPTLIRDGDHTRLDLPFSWLRDVWARGLATIMGRFTLSTTITDNGHWSLLTVSPNDEPPKTITIQMP
jgi:hypothetical protein